MLAGLAGVVVATVLIFVDVALVQADALARDGGMEKAVTVVGAVAFWAGVLALLAGCLAWIVKIGVRAARDN